MTANKGSSQVSDSFTKSRQLLPCHLPSTNLDSSPLFEPSSSHFATYHYIAGLTTLIDLPPELLLHALDLLLLDDSLSPHFLLVSVSRVNRYLNQLAQPLLYSTAACTVTSLTQFDRLLRTLEDRHPGKQWAQLVTQFRVEGRVFASKGYGARVQRALKVCTGLQELEVVGVDDLRPKFLIGNGSLSHLTLLNSSFRANSHTCPPSLPLFLSSIRSLTLANVGLPPPATHLTDILTHSAPTLEHLAISSLRDADLLEFKKAARIIVTKCTNLRSLMLGFLTDEQVQALTLPLLQAPAAPFSTGLSAPPLSPSTISSSLTASLAPALSHFPITHLTFTLPHPSLPLLLALPLTLRVLTLRPPYSRSTDSSSSIFGTSKSSLLSILNRTRASSSSTSSWRSDGLRGQGSFTPAASSGSATPVRGRRTSVTLEQLEEEEEVLLALEEALAVPSLSSAATRRGGAKGKEQEMGEVVAPRLERIRWECRAMRCAKERVQRVVERREEWRARRYPED